MSRALTTVNNYHVENTEIAIHNNSLQLRKDLCFGRLRVMLRLSCTTVASQLHQYCGQLH